MTEELEEFKIFNKWDLKNVEVKDPGLKDYINLEPVLAPRKSRGRHASKQLKKSDVNIIERLMNHLLNPGHRGKKHKISSGRVGGASAHGYKIIEKCLEILEKETKKNPVEVLVKAIENAAVREEVSSYQIGSIIARKSVVTSPQRRVDLALRYFAQGAYGKKFKGNKGMEHYLAEEILNAYNNSKDSFAIQEKERLEREATGAR